MCGRGMMMKVCHYLKVFAAILLVCLLFSGCSIIGLDVENQLIPPQNDKEQNAMQEALYNYLQSYNFTLTYPNDGEYQTPFIVLNQIKEKEILSEKTVKAVLPDTNSLDNWGIVFYRWNLNNAKTKIHLLKKNENGVWESVADIEGLSEEVAEVNFADINGDGFPELFVGWNLYNTTDKRLSIYRMDRQLSAVAFENAYTALRTADMTDDKAEDLLLFNIGSGEAEVKARLYSYVNNQMQFRGETQLDSGIKRIGDSIVAALSPTVNGIFVDCQKDADTTITELLYWNNSSLESPFSDKQGDINTVTARENGLACRDIDGDGIVEWPVSKRVSGYENAALEKTLWRTDWMSYDFRTAQIEKKFSSVVNPMDGYMLRLRDEWTENAVTLSYDEGKHILSVGFVGDSESFLQLLATHSDVKIVLPDGFSYFEGPSTWYYAVCINDEIVTTEEIQYLFAVL